MTARKPHRGRRSLPIADPAHLNVALGGLDARERRIVELRYGIGEVRTHSLAQIGRRFGITGERVRQIETRALHTLAAHDGNPAPKPAMAAKRVASPDACMPRNALQAWTLLLLRRQPSHGYDLLRRLDCPGSEAAGPRLYRLLRDLEQDGLVRSDWTDSAGGPERRVYRPHPQGSPPARRRRASAPQAR